MTAQEIIQATAIKIIQIIVSETTLIIDHTTIQTIDLLIEFKY